MALLLFLLLFSGFVLAADLKLFVAKSFFNQNEPIELFGALVNYSLSGMTPLTSRNVTLNVTNNATLIAVYNFTTDDNGSFYSNGSYHPGATQVNAPSSAGTYNLTAAYNESGTVFRSLITIDVGNKTIDQLLLQPNQAEYLPGQAANVTATAIRGTGSQSVHVPGVYVSGSLRHLNQTVISAFSCTTSSDGSCTVSFSAPSVSAFESFILEANNYEGYALFSVSSFSVALSVKDAEGQAAKETFSPSETGMAEVRVSINGSAPANGSYTAAMRLEYPNGTAISSLSSVVLNANNSFTNQSTFSTSSLAEGAYVINTTVTQSGSGLARTQRSWIQVISWIMSFQKASENSGFQYGLTTLPNATLLFEAYPQTRTNGTVMTGLASAMRYELKTPLGDTVSNGTSFTYNSSCGASGCYTFNLTAPSGIGTYQLTASATQGGITRSASRTIMANGLAAMASTTDSSGLSKAVFGYNEFANVNFTLRNATGTLNVTNSTLVSVTYENGTATSYTLQSNLSLLNTTDGVLQWGWNETSSRLVLEIPRQGGLYSVEAYVNNDSVKTSAQFFSNPYDTCFTAKASASESTSDYYWQFKPSDIIYLQLTVTEAENAVGSNTSSVTAASGSYGRGSSCSFNSAQKQPVVNATINVTSAMNLDTGLAETLNVTATTCQPMSTQGHYICTVKPNDTTWDSGRYVINLRTHSQDRSITDVGQAYFEAREFYVYGYASNWINQPSSDVSLNVNVYEAGNGWWSSSTGLAGTATLQRIEYLGSLGGWMSSGTTFDYNVSAHNSTDITNGRGNFTLLASRTPAGSWPTGSYKARVQVTTSDGRTDYGDVWFEVRRWDAWAQQVDVSGSIQYRYSNAPTQMVMLYLRITNAGQYSDNGGTSLGGNVTIRVKKLETYNSNGRVELSPSLYNSTPITVSNSSPYPGSLAYTSHILNITPASRFPSGAYNVVLELNSTINGSVVRQQSWGWFSVKAFHAEAQPVNLTTGAYSYSSRGKAPVGFNVTTALDDRLAYTGSAGLNALINTTVVGLRLTQGANVGGSYVSQTLRYPQDVTMSPLTVNGTATLNLSKTSGNWSSGWYYGELTLQDNETSTQNAWIYFTVEPFRITASNAPYQIGRTDNFTVTLSINDPSSNAVLYNANNYNITRVQEVRYSSTGRTIRDAVVPANNSWNGTAVSFNFSAPNATNAWGTSEYGWTSLELTVRDNSDNSTQTYWAGFQTVPFYVTQTLTSQQTLLASQNVSLNITLRPQENSGNTAGNLSSIRFWDTDTSTYRQANFTVEGGCTHLTAPCLLNSTAILPNGTSYAVARAVNVTPPSGAWGEGTTYFEPRYTDWQDASSTLQPGSVYIYVSSPITAYYMTQNSYNWSSQWSYSQTENVTLYLYHIRDNVGSAIPVTINSVQYYSGNEWRESYRTYLNVTSWSLLGSLNNRISAGSSGRLHIPAPSGGWSTGTNYVKVSLQNTDSPAVTGAIKGIYVYVSS